MSASSSIFVAIFVFSYLVLHSIWLGCVSSNFEGVLHVLETSSVLKYLPLSPHRTPRIVITGNVTNHMVWGPDPIFWRPRTLGRRRCGYLSLLHAAFWSHENGSHTSKLPIHLTSAHH